jgi:hypothetical protein
MKLTVFFSLLLVSFSGFACMGGILVVNDELTLYGASAIVEGESRGVNMGDEFKAGDAQIKVVFQKADPGGTQYTTYEITRGGKKEIVKVKTNYLGNGIRTRGFAPIEPKADRTIGCGSH